MAMRCHVENQLHMDFLFRKVLKEALHYYYNQLESYIPLGICNYKKNTKKKIYIYISESIQLSEEEIEKDWEGNPAH